MAECSWCGRNKPVNNEWCRRCISARVSNYQRWKRLERPSKLVLAGVYVLGALWIICETLESVVRWVREPSGDGDR